MKRTNKSIKTISIFLCILMVFLLPVQVCADVTGNEEEELTADFSNISSDGEEVGNIVSEITGERTEYSKTFLLDDGTKMLAEYPEPIHFKNDNNKWIEYNNTLVETVEKATSDEITNECDYTNKKSDIDITLSSSTNSDNLIMLSDDKYKISWGYKNVDDSDINIITQDNATTGNDKFTNLENLSAEAEYEEVFDNIDLQYKVSSTGVKENIILNNSDSQNEFEIIYDIDKLIPNQIDDNTIILYDGNKKVYKIDAPYMVDSKGVSSKKLKLEIISNKNGKLHIKLIADKAFINDNSRSYPIIIDPEISYINNSNVFTYTGIVGNNLSSYPPYYLSSNAYSNWKINSLPVLDNSQVIIKATANFSIGSITGTVANDNPIVVNLYDGKTTSPYYDTQVEDYCAISSASDKLKFDFTRLLKNWMNGSTNHGFVIKSNNIGDRILNISYGETIHSETEETRYMNYPMYTIVYKDFAGTEDSMSYHTVSAGSKAQVSVNDYLGNLVVSQNLYESKAARMPISLSATYNSFDYDTNYTESMMGYGWKFSFNEYIKETNSTLQNAEYDYVYIDEEHTKHYLKETSSGSNKWEDEEDLGLTLTFKDGFGLLDDGSQTKKFRMPSEGGHLMYIYENDNPNNHIGYGRASDGAVQYMYDSTNSTVASFSTTTINGQKYISTINLPKSKKIYLTYTLSNGKVLLTKVTMPDGSISQYSYSNSGMLNSVKYLGQENETEKDGQAVTLQYNSNGQVTNISETSTEGNTGNSLTYQYNNDNTTQVTDIKGRSETYTFDNEGYRISTLNANGFISTDSGSGLTASSGADSFTKNYITESYDFKGVGSGYYFKKSSGCINCNTTKRTKYFGSSSLQVTSNSTSSSTGVEHQFDESDFIGNDITFSAYVKTNITSTTSASSGAYLQIRCFTPDNSRLNTVKSFYINSTDEWQRISVTANVPDSAQYVVVSCNIGNAVGTAYYDCLQLEMGTNANDYNALQDSDFKTNSTWYDESDSLVSVNSGSATINGFPGLTTGTAEDEYEEETEDDSDTDTETPQETTVVTEHDSVDTTDPYGNVIQSAEGEYEKVYYVDNSDQSANDTDGTDDSGGTDTPQDTHDDSTQQTANKYIYQTINVKTADVSFNLIGEAKAKSVPITSSQRTFGIALNIYYQNADGTVSTTPEKHYQEFNVFTTSRQTISTTVIPDDTDSIIHHIDFAFVYGYNSNSMTVYNAMLNISVNKANVLNIDTDGEEETEETTTATEPADSENDVMLGDMVSENLVDSQPFIKTNTTYDSTGNYVMSETDELGNTTSYTYDGNGNKASITDGKGNVVEYEYDDADNVTSISSGNASNSYTYDYLGNVSLITHNNFSYQFNYNQYNKLIETKVGSNTIVTNEYDSNYGNLTRTIYGNSDYIDYEYDLYDNITKISSNTGIIATYEYNKKGLISRIVDNESGDITRYYYDFNGEVQGQYIFSNDGRLSKSISHDENGNTVEKTSVAGVSRTITSGSDDNGEDFVNCDGLQSTKKTDDFNRVTSINTSIDSASPFITTYKYAGGSEEKSTSNTVNRLENRYKGNCYAVYNYTYDNNGNITQVRLNGTLISKYTYDSLNQLHEEYDYLRGRYINYTYDNGGNIKLALESYLNSSGTIGGVCGSKNYTYGDSVWKDKLTKYGSYNITYDEIGNPINYRNGKTFSWKNGRWLASTTLSDNTTVTYQYDANGMRTKKTIGSTATNYYYDSNNNLIGLKSGADVAFFYYDADNSPVSMKYNNNMYYYVKNLQGDIVKILDSNGSAVAGYYYDAWGTITRKTVTNTTIDTLSPFRYRGYVYDIDTGFYYLQSRYYDPTTGRFINADDTKHINDSSNIFGENLFAYCYNQYIKNIDKTGKKATISAGVSSKYYRRRAVEYAKKWWLMRNSQFYSYFEDCTNFVSQCLFEGGIPMMFTEWYSFRIENGIEWSDYTWYISNTWRLCNDNYKYFKNSRYAQKTITIKDKRKSVVSAVKKLKKGDPMYFDDNGDGIPNHAVIITKINTKKKKIKYTAHSFSNIDKDLEKYLTHESGSKKKVYAIHIKNNF